MAQVQKGDWSVNGSLFVGNSFSESDIDNGLLFGNGVSIAHLISDHWMIGLDFQDQIEFDGIGPQLRYFINPSSQKNIYFVDAIYGYDFGEENSQTMLSAGFNRFLSKNLSLEAAASYTFFSELPYNELRLGIGIRSFISGEAYGARKSATSRFGKGTYMLGVGNLEFRSIDGISRAGLSIENALFVTDRLALGLRDQLAFTRWNREGLPNFRSWRHELGAFGRYYLRTSGGRVVPFTELGVGFRNSHTTSTDNYEVNGFQWIAEARVGTSVFLSPEMALEFALIGRRDSRSQLETQYFNRDLYPEEIYPNFDGTQLDRSFELGFHIGLQFFLRQD